MAKFVLSRVKVRILIFLCLILKAGSSVRVLGHTQDLWPLLTWFLSEVANHHKMLLSLVISLKIRARHVNFMSQQSLSKAA